MKKNILRKAFTLCLFVVLLSGFVAFKHGSFNDLFVAKVESAYPAFWQLHYDKEISPLNSPPKILTDSKISPDILVSSKSMVLPSQKIEFTFYRPGHLEFEPIQFPDGDSTKKKTKSANNKANTTTATRKNPEMMPSSKSMVLPDIKATVDTSQKTEKKPK